MMNKKNWYTTEEPSVFFEDTSVGRMKKQLWEASEEEIDHILEEYGIPSPSELGMANTYIQTTNRSRVIERRRKTISCSCPSAARKTTESTPTPAWTPLW